MTVTFSPSKPSGSVAAPPSKSMAHRLLICAGQAIGTQTVHGVAPSEDILATVDCLRALGVKCVLRGGDAILTGYTLHCGDNGAVLPCRESGSTLRFFLPLCLFGPPMTLTGSARLLARPLDVYADICEKQGIRFEKGERAVTVRGPLGTVVRDADTGRELGEILEHGQVLRVAEGGRGGATGTVQSS